MLVTLVSILSVISRTGLTLIDRSIYKNLDLGFFRLNISSISLPLAIGLISLFFLNEWHSFYDSFFTLHCFAFSLITHLVSLSFTFSFRSFKVNHVILQSKISELFLPFICIFLSGLNQKPYMFFPILISWVGIVPLLRNSSWHIFKNKSSLFLIASMSLQMIVVQLLTPMHSYGIKSTFIYTLGTFSWRLLFLCPFFLQELRNQSEHAVAITSKKTLVWLIGTRAFLSILVQGTFIWAIFQQCPLLVWPILNTTPLVSSIASRVILKESISKEEMIPLFCFFVSAVFSVFLVNI